MIAPLRSSRSLISSAKGFLHGPFHATQAKRLGGGIVAQSKDSLTLLDVGCGDMVITKFISDHLPGRAITGLDVVDYRRRNLPLVLYGGRRIPFENGSFDTVYAILALHHCENEEFVLGEMLRVAKKRVVLIEEVYRNPVEKLITFVHDWVSNKLEFPGIPVPFHFHNDAEWKQLFKKLRGKLVYEKRVWQFPFPFNFTRQKLYVLSKRG